MSTADGSTPRMELSRKLSCDALLDLVELLGLEPGDAPAPEAPRPRASWANTGSHTQAILEPNTGAALGSSRWQQWQGQGQLQLLLQVAPDQTTDDTLS